MRGGTILCWSFVFWHCCDLKNNKCNYAASRNHCL